MKKLVKSFLGKIAFILISMGIEVFVLKTENEIWRKIYYVFQFGNFVYKNRKIIKNMLLEVAEKQYCLMLRLCQYQQKSNFGAGAKENLEL